VSGAAPATSGEVQKGGRAMTATNMEVHEGGGATPARSSEVCGWGEAERGGTGGWIQMPRPIHRNLYLDCP
jgi:hypothetical protein